MKIQVQDEYEKALNDLKEQLDRILWNTEQAMAYLGKTIDELKETIEKSKQDEFFSNSDKAYAESIGK